MFAEHRVCEPRFVASEALRLMGVPSIISVGVGSIRQVPDIKPQKNLQKGT